MPAAALAVGLQLQRGMRGWEGLPVLLQMAAHCADGTAMNWQPGNLGLSLRCL